MDDLINCDNVIEKQMFISYIPQENEVAERVNRIIIEITRSMLRTQKLDKSFWTETVVNTNLHTKLLSNKGVRFYYARRSTKKKEALHCTHACVWLRRLRNGVGCTKW